MKTGRREWEGGGELQTERHLRPDRGVTRLGLAPQAPNSSSAPEMVVDEGRHFGTLDTTMRNPQTVVHAYRHFYRQGLKAIHYSTPSRHILVKTLRSSFRSSSPDDFNPQRVSNTLRFLQRATDVAGIEHKILKNLMITRYWEQPHTMKNARM